MTDRAVRTVAILFSLFFSDSDYALGDKNFDEYSRELNSTFSFFFSFFTEGCILEINLEAV